MKREKETLKESVLRNTSWNFLFNIINRFGGLIFTIIIARLLLPELFGIYSLVLGLTLLFMSAIDQGINTTITKFTSEALGRNDKVKARGYFIYLLRLKALISGTAGVILFIFSEIIASYFFSKPEIILPLRISSIYLFSNAVLTSFIHLFYAVKKIKYVAMQETLYQFLRIFLVLLLFRVIALKVESVLISLILSVIVSAFFLVFIANRDFKFIFKGKKADIDRKRLLRFFFFITIASITSSVFVHFDIVILGLLLDGTELIGFYQVASTIVISIAAIISFSNVSLPVFTQLESVKLQNSFSKFFHYSALFSIPLSFGLPFVATPFIILLFGAEYLPAVLPLTILSFLIFESATGIFFTVILAAKEKPKEIAKFMLIANVMNIALSYMLITYLARIKPEYGLLGAAIAVVVSRYFYLASLMHTASKKFSITVDKASIYKPVFAGAIMVLFLLLSGSFFSGVIAKSVQIALAASIYFITLFMIKGIVKEDFEILKSVLSLHRIRR